MRYLLLATLIVSPLVAYADRNSFAFYAYQQRLQKRRDNALAIRRQLNYGKHHVYRTAIHVPYNPMNPTGVGMIPYRRPEPRRTYIYVPLPYSSDY